MANVATEYGTTTALTITLASLGDAAGRESTVVSNTTNKYLDALVTAQITTQNSGTISDPKAVFFYAYATSDTTPTYPDNVTGTDAAITLDSPTQLRLLGTIYVAAINTAYISGPWSVASLYGGRLPSSWGVVAYNDCGTALSATGGDHFVKYQGIYASVA